jgi:hypothetical protein
VQHEAVQQLVKFCVEHDLCCRSSSEASAASLWPAVHILSHRDCSAGLPVCWVLCICCKHDACSAAVSASWQLGKAVLHTVCWARGVLEYLYNTVTLTVGHSSKCRVCNFCHDWRPFDLVTSGFRNWRLDDPITSMP